MWKLDAREPDDWTAILRPYEKLALDVVWERGDEGIGSGLAWRKVNHRLRLAEKSKISRASVIFFLNRCVDSNIMGFRDETGKGGYHRIYVPAMEWDELEDHIVSVFIRKLGLIFPENTILGTCNLND